MKEEGATYCAYLLDTDPKSAPSDYDARFSRWFRHVTVVVGDVTVLAMVTFLRRWLLQAELKTTCQLVKALTYFGCRIQNRFNTGADNPGPLL